MLLLKKRKEKKIIAITNRLNLKKYLLGSLVPTATCYFFSKDQNDVIGISIVLFATILNQLMLVSIVGEAIGGAASSGSSKEDVNKKRIVLFFVLKFIVLFLGLYGGYHFMGKRVIIPLLNYVVLIFILTLSIKKR